MDPVLAWGLDVIRAFQSFSSPAMTLFMKAASFAGTEYFYIALLIGVYWCVDRRVGARLAVLVLLSTGLDLWLKSTVGLPRPFDADPSVGMAFEPTFSFPSNHAQNAVVFWGAAAVLFRGPWRIVLVVLPPLLIGVSRVYLGVHFPTDVAAGWAIGALIVWLYYLTGDRIERFLAGLRQSLRFAAASAPVLAMVAMYRQDVSMAGTLFGFAAGLIYLPGAAGFSAGGTGWRKALRYLLGAASVAVVYAAPKLLAAGLEAGGPPLVRFLRYAALGLWAGAGAPWLFMKLRLADRAAPESEEGEAGPHSA
jgi:membrane-associated phospholipid phosphatase